MTAIAPTKPEKSTIVRLFVAPRSVRGLFRLLEHTAPGLGARWAERIWFTLPRRGEPAGIAQLAPGLPFAVDVGGHWVVGESWGAGPVVYLVHGWAGHRGQLAAFGPPLVAHGYRVVAFDAPSHGASAPGAFGPRSSSIPEFAAALTAVAAARGRRAPSSPTPSAARPPPPRCATGFPPIGSCCSPRWPARSCSPANSRPHSVSVTGPTGG